VLRTQEAAEATDALAKKWAVEVTYQLAAGPQRYNELLKGLDETVTPKVFTRVLRRLEAENIVERHIVDQSPPGVVYQLTRFGYRLVAALDDIAELWQSRHLDQSA